MTAHIALAEARGAQWEQRAAGGLLGGQGGGRAPWAFAPGDPRLLLHSGVAPPHGEPEGAGERKHGARVSAHATESSPLQGLPALPVLPRPRGVRARPHRGQSPDTPALSPRAGRGTPGSGLGPRATGARVLLHVPTPCFLSCEAPFPPPQRPEAPPDAGAAPGEAQRLQCRALQGGSAAHLKGGTGQVCQGACRPRADKGPSLAGGGATGPAATPSPGARGATPWVPQPAPAHWLGAVPWPRPVQGQGWAWVGHIWPADQPSEAGLTTMALTGAQVPEAQWPVSAGGGRAPQVPPAQPGNPCTSQP